MRNKVKILILGAGAGGLGAAVWAKYDMLDFMVVDGNKELPLNLHNGVHYLHTVPPLPFKTDIKKITLTDAILNEGKMYDRPSLKFALQYSEKTGEIQRPSSIMAVGKDDTAYMPSSNSLNGLLKEMYEYAEQENFEFGWWFKTLDPINKIAVFQNAEGKMESVEYEYLVSTIPLDKMPSFGDDFIKNLKLECNPIYVANYKIKDIVPNWMINIYIPDLRTPIYRASILNGICSTESIKPLTDHDVHQVADFLNMFHLNFDDIERYEWKTGKVISISPDDRAKLVDILKGFSVYQVGRFGLWNRKLLIDSTIEQAKLVMDYIDESIEWEIVKQKLVK